VKQGKGFRHYPNQDKFKEQVLEGYKGLSGLSGQPADDAHHCIPKQTLALQNIPEAAADPRNGIALTRHEHESIHNGSLGLTYHLLPRGVFDFAAEYDLEWYLVKHYGMPVMDEEVE
jgi:hypothetical protein